jgi:subtilisin family serine protease
MLKYFTIILLVSGVIFGKSQAQEYNSYLIRYKGDSQKLISEMNIIGIKCDKTIEEKYTKQNDNNRFLSNLQATRLSQLSYYYTVSASDFVQISQMYNYLKSDENFISLEPNYIYKISQDNIKPNDSLYQDLWWLQAVNTEKAWKKASGNGVIIGLIDTGIDFEHPDLMENLWVNPKEDINGNGKFDAWSVSEFRNGISGDLNGIDDDGNGYIDDVIGYDFVDQSVVNFGDY